MKHYNEVELLEHYYLGGSGSEISAHVAGCPECESRYARLREKLSCSALDHRQAVETKSESFWARQRAAISSRLAGEQRRSYLAPWRLAVAALLALLIGAGIFIAVTDRSASTQVAQEQPAAQTSGDGDVAVVEFSSDAWETDQLQPYAEVVEWESWLNEEEEGT